MSGATTSTNATSSFLSRFHRPEPTYNFPDGADTTMDDSGLDGLYPGHSGDSEDFTEGVPPPDATTATTSLPSLVGGIPGFQDLKPLARALKTRTDFSERAQRDIDNFVEATEAEKGLLHYGLLLQVRDLLNDQKKGDSLKYVIPEALKESLKTYSRALLLSPKLGAYRGNNAESIMNILRELHVQGLPPPQEISSNTAIRTQIGKLLTGFRSTIKATIKASMDVSDGDESNVRNIADLTFALANQCQIQVTTRHYMRVAFLRWAVNEHKDVSEENFWGEVDKSLDELRSLDDEIAITNALKLTYEEDKNLYGKPEDTDRRVVDIAKINDWQNVVDKHAREVIGQNKKRKRC